MCINCIAFQGIYPTALVVLVALTKTYYQSTLRYESMESSTPSAPPHRAMQPQQPAIQLERVVDRFRDESHGRGEAHSVVIVIGPQNGDDDSPHTSTPTAKESTPWDV